MSPARIAPLTAFLAAAAFYLVAQPPAAVTPVDSAAPSSSSASDSAAPTPTIHVTSRLVVLDVVVTGADGKPALGLKPSDFSITEDGVPQKLAAFTEHGSPEIASPNTALPTNTFTVQPPPKEDQAKTVIVLADATSWSATAEMPQFASVSAVNRGYVRDDIAAFVKNGSPAQPIGIVRLDWQGMHLVQGLTTDRNILTEAIASKRMQPPLGFVVRFARAGGSPMQQLARYVNSIPGRVNLVWITYGGGSPVGEMQNDFPDLSLLVHNLEGTANVLRLSRVSLSIIPLTQGNVWANMALKQAADAAGGHAYFTGVAQGLQEISTIGSSYYTISYVPNNGNWNGAFRKVGIKVAGFPQAAPPETLSSAWSELLGWTEPEKSHVLYRRGYFARFRPVLDVPPPSGLPARTVSPMPLRIALASADGNKAIWPQPHS